MIKNFKDYLTEIFEPNTKWRSFWKGPKKEFAIEMPAYAPKFSYNGGVYMVHIIRDFDPELDYWTFDFGLFSGPKGVGIIDPYSITNTGDAIPVFNIVLDILLSFVQLKKPETITFTAKESSRIKLYSKMLKSLLPKFNLNYRVIKQLDIDGEMRFILIRNSDKLNEVFNTKVKWDKKKFISQPFDLKYYDVDFQIDSFNFSINFYYNSYGILNSGPAWLIEFGRKNPHNNEYEFNIINDNKIAFKLFSVIIDIIYEFIKLHTPEAFYFSAHEKSRAKLYHRLIQLLRNKIPQYEVETTQPYRDTFFIFTKKDQPKPVNEVFNTKIEWNRNLIPDLPEVSYFINIPFEIDGVEFEAEITEDYSQNYNNKKYTQWTIGFFRKDKTDPTWIYHTERIVNDMKFHFKVFSVMIDIIQEFVKKQKPDRFVFTGKEENRVKLYKRLAQTIGSKNKDYKLSYGVNHGEDAFFFTRKTKRKAPPIEIDEDQEIMVESENMDSFIKFIKNYSM